MEYWIVVVDDEPLCLTNARAILSKTDMRVSCLRSGENLLRFLENNSPDLILLDIMMPDMDGFETYRAVRQYEEKTGKSQIPVIFLTGEEDKETERRGLRAGASDFIHKPFDEAILIKRIKNTITNSKTIETLTEEATVDRLTGFFNKMSGTQKVSGMCADTSGALMIMDLDNFKLVNDLYGHDMGDRVLIAFSGVVRHNVRSDDVLCRIGGDEFMAFFPNMSGPESAFSLSDRLNAQLLLEAEALMGRDHGLPLGISIGVAFTDEDTKDYKVLFQYADSALYEVKRNGKHGIRVYDPSLAGKRHDESTDRDLERIMQIMAERGERKGGLLLGQEAFSLNYQYIDRFMSRYGGTVTRLLFSLSAEADKEISPEVSSEFAGVLSGNIRRTDIILRWRQDCYFAVLPCLEERLIPGVADRIIRAWEDCASSDGIRIRYSCSTAFFDGRHSVHLP